MEEKDKVNQCLNYVKNLDELSWNQEIYEDFINVLDVVSEEKYGDFSAKLLPKIPRECVKGIRLGTLQKIAKQIVKGNYECFLEIAKDNATKRLPFLEEDLIRAFVIGNVTDIQLVCRYIQEFVPRINNWSVCDSFCARLKITKKHESQIYMLIQNYLKSNKEYEQRFAYVMLLDYYRKEEYKEFIFQACNRDDLNGYYVKMAVAWLLSMCYISFPTETITFLQECRLDIFTYNKAIQKMIESRQLSIGEKTYLKTLKRH